MARSYREVESVKQQIDCQEEFRPTSGHVSSNTAVAALLPKLVREHLHRKSRFRQGYVRRTHLVTPLRVKLLSLLTSWCGKRVRLIHL